MSEAIGAIGAIRAVERMCGFKNCPELADARFFCKKHTCKDCDSANGHLLFIKKAHVISDKRHECSYTVCGGAIDDKVIGIGKYVHINNICMYDECESYKKVDDLTCSYHKSQVCTICLCEETNTQRCAKCATTGKYRCCNCKTIYKRNYITPFVDDAICYKCYYNTSDVYCGKVDVIGKYISNIYNYKKPLFYTIKLYKYYNRKPKDAFFSLLISLPQDLINNILNFTDLQPSFVTVEKFVSQHQIKTIFFFNFFILYF